MFIIHALIPCLGIWAAFVSCIVIAIPFSCVLSGTPHHLNENREHSCLFLTCTQVCKIFHSWTSEIITNYLRSWLGKLMQSTLINDLIVIKFITKKRQYLSIINTALMNPFFWKKHKPLFFFFLIHEFMLLSLTLYCPSIGYFEQAVITQEVAKLAHLLLSTLYCCSFIFTASCLSIYLYRPLSLWLYTGWSLPQSLMGSSRPRLWAPDHHLQRRSSHFFTPISFLQILQIYLPVPV